MMRLAPFGFGSFGPVISQPPGGGFPSPWLRGGPQLQPFQSPQNPGLRFEQPMPGGPMQPQPIGDGSQLPGQFGTPGFSSPFTNLSGFQNQAAGQAAAMQPPGATSPFGGFQSQFGGSKPTFGPQPGFGQQPGTFGPPAGFGQLGLGGFQSFGQKKPGLGFGSFGGVPPFMPTPGVVRGAAY